MSAETPKLRGVLAGLGVMGSLHLRVLRSMPEVELVAVVDADAERRDAAVRPHRGLRAYTTLTEAIERESLDFACIAVPVGVLPELTLEALVGGLDVLVEKPTAPTEELAWSMIREAEARGRVLGVGHVERFNPAVRAMKAKIEEGLIGDVLHLHARRLSPYPNRAGSQGVALDLATHDIDVIRYVTGQEIARVFAEADAPLSGPDGEEDIICATLRLDSESMALVETNWMTPAKVRQISVLGELGMLVVDYLSQDLNFYQHPTKATEWDQLAGMRGGGEGDMVRFALDRREPLRVEWEEFLSAARHGRPAPVTGWDGIAALSTAHAIRASGSSHETVVPAYRQRLSAPA